jgi:DNA-binding GntR family transcriptional regulator
MPAAAAGAEPAAGRADQGDCLPTNPAQGTLPVVTIQLGGPAYEQIRQAIVEGRYRPGQRLIEQRIAEELDLSRTPIREALRMLDAEGLVITEPNRGAIVRPIAAGDVEDLYELRGRLESYAAFRASKHRTDEHLAEMDEAIRGFGAGLRQVQSGNAADVRELTARNFDFHRAVIEAADHERLGVLLRRATDVPLVFQAFRIFDQASLERSDLFHRLIRDAIRARDAARAERLMVEHIDEGRDALLESVRAKGSLEALFES